MEAEAVVVERKRSKPTTKIIGVQIDYLLPPLSKPFVSEEEAESRRLRWNTLADRIEELVTQLNMQNVETVSHQLRDLDDLVVGPGLVAKAFWRYQMESPELTSVYAASVAVVNAKFPMVGKILSRRIIFYISQVFIRRQLQPTHPDEMVSVATFFAHLIKQRVVRLAAASEMLCVLLKNPSDENVDIARRFVIECGSSIQSLTASYIYRKCIGLNSNIVHGGPLAKKVLRAAKEFGAIIAKAKAQSSPAGRPELDLVNEEDQCTHISSIYNPSVYPYPEFDTFSSSFFNPRGSIDW